ncbi:MAG: hypothetical protein RL120_07945, partial [Gammaproteobacteria bacterium]
MTKQAPSAQNDSAPSLHSLEYQSEFVDRHIGPSADEIASMLGELKLDSLEQLIEQTVPGAIALQEPLALADPMPEHRALAKL